MRSRIYLTVGCPSVRLSVPQIDSSSGVRRVCCWARAPAAYIDRYLARLQPAFSSRCGPRHVESRGTRLDTDLFIVVLPLFIKITTTTRSREILLGSIYGVQCVAAFYCMLQWRVQYTGPRDVKTVAVPRWGTGPQVVPRLPKFSRPKNCG